MLKDFWTLSTGADSVKAVFSSYHNAVRPPGAVAVKIVTVVPVASL